MADKELFQMTKSGVAKLQAELDERKGKIREEVSERIQVARSFGDLSENSEYDDAKQAQAENETRINEIENILKNVQIIDDSEISKTEVSLGSVVTLKDVANDYTDTYYLVGVKEEDVFNNRISIESPVGMAIQGKKKGAKVWVQTPSGPMEYEILKIGRP